MRQIAAKIEEWPYETPFVISRETFTMVDIVVVEIRDGEHVGYGECDPQPHDGESNESVLKQIEGVRAAIEAGAGREALLDLLPPGAARNGVDCALWSLESRIAGRRVWELAGLERPRPITTFFTLSANAPEEMGRAAAAVADWPILKLKLKGHNDVERVRAVREAAPGTRIVVDVNEGWTIEQLKEYAPPLAELGVEMIEQPVPAGADHALSGYRSPIPLCADESCHTEADLDFCEGRYDYINIKLDKVGGLTSALRLLDAAERKGFKCMVGCMQGTSLAMAPAALVAQRCAFADLDAPLLLGSDRAAAVRYEGATLLPPSADVWG